MVAAADRARAAEDTAMISTRLLYWLVVAISAVTVLSGAVLILWPGPVLGFFGCNQSPTAMHFFGVIGMLMALFGGALLNALFSGRNAPIVVLWSGLQKAGGVIGMIIGIAHGIFLPMGWLLAGFDFVSAVLILTYLSRIGWR
jgi:hypothetical protein